MNMDANLEKRVTKFYLIPSLEHISAANIIITLWSQADIKYEIVKLFNSCEYYGYYPMLYHNSWSNIEDKVLDKVSKLVVPDLVRKKLSYIVPPIGQEILDWIKYQDRYIFNYSRYCSIEPKSTAINYIHDLVWMSTGVIDYNETAQILLAEKDLSDIYKYIIACAYCREDTIAIISPQISNSSLSTHYRGMQTIVYFWTAHLTENFTELHKAFYSYNRMHSANYSLIEYVFKMLIDDGINMVAIKYIWNKLGDEEKSRQVVAAAKRCVNIDLKCFLLSQMSEEQQEEFFKTDAIIVLLHFFHNWLWEQHFLPTICNIWHVIAECDYLVLLECIVNKIDENQGYIIKYNHYRSLFKELWQCTPKHLKESILELENGYRAHIIFFRLFNKKNVDIIQSILFDCNNMQKKEIIFSNKGIKHCHLFITTNEWDLLEMFMESTLLSEDVEHFKKAFIKAKGYDIAIYFIQNKEWDKIEQVLKWAFKSDEEIKEFKTRLSYSKITDDLLESIVANNKADFTELEHFVKWCASGYEERVIEFKIEIPELYFHKVICKLIEEVKYEMLDEILNWCFSNNQKKIYQFKHTFF